MVIRQFSRLCPENSLNFSPLSLCLLTYPAGSLGRPICMTKHPVFQPVTLRALGAQAGNRRLCRSSTGLTAGRWQLRSFSSSVFFFFFFSAFLLVAVGSFRRWCPNQRVLVCQGKGGSRVRRSSQTVSIAAYLSSDYCGHPNNSGWKYAACGYL